MADFSTVASTIQTIEGWFSGSVSQTNNNPGNLMYVGQAGATGADANGFAVFPTVAAGEQALQDQINLDASRGLTVAQFAAKYAPASAGNDPTSYAQQIASAAGVDVNDPLLAAADGETGGGADLYTSVSALPADTSDYSTLDLSSIGLGVITLTPGVVLGTGAALLGLLWLMNKNR